MNSPAAKHDGLILRGGASAMASCPHALTCASSRLERVDVLDVDDDGTTRVLHAPFLGERDSIVEGRARFVICAEPTKR